MDEENKGSEKSPAKNETDQNTEYLDEKLEKHMTKVKTNSGDIVPNINRGLSEDVELAISYIPNTEKLRDKNNCIPLTVLMADKDPRTKIMCNICYETDRRFLVSKCGHVSCEICWEIRLRELMECPICKQKVRRKTLIEIVHE